MKHEVYQITWHGTDVLNDVSEDWLHGELYLYGGWIAWFEEEAEHDEEGCAQCGDYIDANSFNLTPVNNYGFDPPEQYQFCDRSCARRWLRVLNAEHVIDEQPTP